LAISSRHLRFNRLLLLQIPPSNSKVILTSMQGVGISVKFLLVIPNLFRDLPTSLNH
jgi:hypothetical protein